MGGHRGGGGIGVGGHRGGGGIGVGGHRGGGGIGVGGHRGGGGGIEGWGGGAFSMICSFNLQGVSHSESFLEALDALTKLVLSKIHVLVCVWVLVKKN